MDDHSSHYTVLARRFRPQTFGEVVGQEHVAQAIRNAIKSERVAHAYLFTGARGVGKTSMARILAKSLNCPHVKDGDPCNACEICDGISAGNDVDVLEIDGASNRGIDDIRSLRANVNVKSMRTVYKLYIIDEVHMLTKEAFNALLKTLEEPPPNVKFVFCTTEPNKLPDTILSRCQRFDFGTIATTSIAGRLVQIAEAEKVQVDADAIELVARRASGSMRDSQSLFDQLLAFSDEQITAADVHRLLGTASDDRLIEMVDALISRRPDSVLEAFNRAISDGVQLGELTDQLLSYLRDLMVLAAGANEVPLLSVGDSQRKRLSEQARDWGLQTLVAAMQILAETKGRMQRVTYGRALAELALIRISLLEDLESLDQLVGQLKSGAPLSGVPLSAPPAAAKSSARMAAPTPTPTPTPTPNRNLDASPTPSEPPPSAPPASYSAEANSGPNLAPTAEKKNDAPVIAVAEPRSDTRRIEFRDGCEKELWAEILSQVDDMYKTYVKCVSLTAISGPNQLDLTFPRSYHFNKQFCERPEVRSRLEEVASELTGQKVQISLFVAEEEASMAVKADVGVAAKQRPLDAGDDEFVQKALDVFGASVERVVPFTNSPPRKD